MKFVSWNVAGYRACLKKGFIDFFEAVGADAFCLQEVKAVRSEITYKPEGYYLYLFPAVKKGYAGTLIYTRHEPLAVKYGIGIPDYDLEGRLITLEYNNYYLINAYVPNIKRDLSRLPFRTKWEATFLEYIKILEQTKPVIICGDFNVAHTEDDIKNAKANVKNAGFTQEERAMFTNLLNHGFIDTFRNKYPNVRDAYSWWSYRKGVRERNIGWRIDYFLISKCLEKQLIDAHIYHDVMGSDHCPVGIEIELR